MAKQEALFSKMICSLLAPHVYVQPIESRLTGLGIPDLYMHIPSASSIFPIWCELKDMGDADQLLGAKIAFEPGQYNKLLELYRAKALAFVMVYWKEHACSIPLDCIDRVTQRIKKESLMALHLRKIGPLKAGARIDQFSSDMVLTLGTLRSRQEGTPL